MSFVTQHGTLSRFILIQPVREHTVFIKTVDQKREPVLPTLMIEAEDHSLDITFEGLDGDKMYLVVINQKTGSPAVYEIDKITREPKLMWEVKP